MLKVKLCRHIQIHQDQTPIFPSLIMSLILSAIFNRNILISNALMGTIELSTQKKKKASHHS